VAPKPYLSGVLATGANEIFGLRPVIPPDMHDSMDFKEKVTKSFEVALRTGVDILIAMTSVLVKTGNDFNKLSKRKKTRRHMMHPSGLYRVGRAFLHSKLENRDILPKDLWPVKALIGWGIDTSIYGDEVSKDDAFYEPRTVSLSEVKPGERYELVITSFNGMPFVRYRLGHLIRVTALTDEEAEIYLPQISFETRADDLIDIAGFTRISEKTVTQALANTGLHYEDWSIRKEVKHGKPALHLYIELNHDYQQADLSSILHSELMNVDPFYRDLAVMMEVQPPEVTALLPGTFNDYYKERKDNGSQLAQRKPPRMNASDEIIAALLTTRSRQVAQVG